MDRPGHRFSLRRQIVWSTRVFTVLTSLAVCAALFFLSNQYVRTNTLQAAEFNLRLVAQQKYDFVFWADCSEA